MKSKYDWFDDNWNPDIKLSTTSPLIFFNASNTELHARLLLFSRRSIHSSFVYSPFLPFRTS